MKKIKLSFSNFYSPASLKEILSKRFSIEPGFPDFLISGDLVNKHKNCKKIFFTGENIRPNFNHCDFAISFDYMENDNHFRFPLIALMIYENKISKTFDKNIDFENIKKEKTNFCNFIFSNPAPCSPRKSLFLELSKYKNIDSGGNFLNNMNQKVLNGWNNKLQFIKQYKFTIAYENSEYPGYTTEKLLHPMMTNSIPIYWGNPVIDKDFNTKSFINAYDFSSTREMIEFIKEVDNNDELYFKILSEPYFKGGEIPSSLNIESLLDFFENKVFRDKKIFT